MPDSEAEIVELVRRFVDRDVRLAVGDLEHTNCPSRSAHRHDEATRLYGLAIFEPFGFVQASARCFVLVTEELAHGGMSLAVAMAGHTVVSKLPLECGADDRSIAISPSRRPASCAPQRHSPSPAQAADDGAPWRIAHVRRPELARPP